MGFWFPRSGWSLGRLTVQPACKSSSVIPKRVRGCWGAGENCKSFTFIAIGTYAAALQQPSIPAPLLPHSSMAARRSPLWGSRRVRPLQKRPHPFGAFLLSFLMECHRFFHSFWSRKRCRRNVVSPSLSSSSVREDRQQREEDNVVYLNTIKSQLRWIKNTPLI